MNDIFFIDYGSDWSEKNWKILKSKFIFAKKIKWSKKSLEETFAEVAAQSLSKEFYIVDGSINILPNFNFTTRINEWDEEYVHVFRTFSSINLNYHSVYLLSKNYSKPIKFKQVSKLVGYQTNIFDIFFISYNESYADQNWENLLLRFPQAKRINGIKGIHNAHMEAAKNATSEMFWVVDADAIILENFDFTYKPKVWDRDAVHVWKSKNPVNDLTYGYGGVKLLPTSLTLSMDTSTVDMTTSISKKFIPIKKFSNITNFNTDSFNSWKSAFRECVKLAGTAINGQVTEETTKRLATWCSKGIDEPYGKWCIAGAQAGRKYGSENAGNSQALSKINDFDWLRRIYNEL